MSNITNFLALDLEMNQPTKTIIQVGISVGNMEQHYEDFFTKKFYINVDEEISEYITNLTGITNADTKEQGVSLNNVAEELSLIIDKYNCFINPVTWGSGDQKDLLKAFVDKGIKFQHFGRRWIDVKTIYTFLMLSSIGKVDGGLKSCMDRFKIRFIGKAHGADIDAMNTLRFFFYLVNRQKKINKVISDIHDINFGPIYTDTTPWKNPKRLYQSKVVS